MASSAGGGRARAEVDAVPGRRCRENVEELVSAALPGAIVVEAALSVSALPNAWAF
jgi:hypothetical protein